MGTTEDACWTNKDVQALISVWGEVRCGGPIQSKKESVGNKKVEGSSMSGRIEHARKEKLKQAK